MISRPTFKLLSIFIIFIVSCKQGIEHKKSKYFEGFVDFDIIQSFTSEDNGAVFIPTKSRTYVNSKGYFSRQYIDSNSIIVSWQVFRPDSLCIYQYANNSDTIFRMPTSDDSDDKNIDMIDVKPIAIKGQYYPGCKVLNKYFDSRSGLYVNYYTTYYYDTTKLLHPDSYKKCVRGGYERIFSKYPYLTVGYIFEYPGASTIHAMATRIAESDVPDLHFELPKKRAIVATKF